MPKAVIAAGLPESKVSDVIKAMQSSDFAKVYSPDVVAAATMASKEATCKAVLYVTWALSRKCVSVRCQLICLLLQCCRDGLDGIWDRRDLRVPLLQRCRPQDDKPGELRSGKSTSIRLMTSEI